jgi:hypothetical protein
MLGGAVGLPSASHKQLHRPSTPIDIEAWREALLQSAKNQVRLSPGVNVMIYKIFCTRKLDKNRLFESKYCALFYDKIVQNDWFSRKTQFFQ